MLYDDTNLDDDVWRSRPQSPIPFHLSKDKGEDEPGNTSEPRKDPPYVDISLMLLCSAASMTAALSGAPTPSVGPDPGLC